MKIGVSVRLCRGLFSGGNAEIPAFAGMTKKGAGVTKKKRRGDEEEKPG